MCTVINVLVVDDEEIMRNLITDILQEEEKIQVIAFSNGPEALDKMRDMPIAVVFLDVHMPLMNGLETLKAIKKAFPKTPVVMMDSYPDQLLDDSLREGVIACIHKPFILKEIRDIFYNIIK